MRVVSFGIPSGRPEYPRHRNMVDGLRAHDVEVVECQYAMASSFQARYHGATRITGVLGLGCQLLWSWLPLTWRFLSMPTANAILIGHPGLFHAPLVKWLRRLRMKRAVLILDMFTPVHETLVHDRSLFRESSLIARCVQWLEKRACHTADVCLVDSESHGRQLCRDFGLPSSKCRRVWVGPCFSPYVSPKPTAEGGAEFLVLFVGTFIPLHGARTIVEAAGLLAAEPGIRFLMVGNGQERPKIERMVSESRVANVELRDWVAPDRLGELIRTCDVALGCFGDTRKAELVIPHKIYDASAAGVPFVTADTVAVREAFRHGESAFLVPSANPLALASAIRRLRDDPQLRRRLAKNALKLAHERLSPERIGRTLLETMTPRQPRQCETTGPSLRERGGQR